MVLSFWEPGHVEALTRLRATLGKLRQDLGLAPKAAERVVVLEVIAHDLERDRLVRTVAPREVDDAHTALAERALDPEDTEPFGLSAFELDEVRLRHDHKRAWLHEDGVMARLRQQIADQRAAALAAATAAVEKRRRVIDAAIAAAEEEALAVVAADPSRLSSQKPARDGTH